MNICFFIMLAFFALMVIGGGYMGLIRMVFNMISFFLSTILALVLALVFSAGFGLGAKGTVISFLICFILAYVVLIIVSFSLKIINTVPIVSTVNNILGAILGAVLATLIIWIFMAVVGALPASSFTTSVLSQIEANPLTKALYENNLVQVALDKFLWKNADITVKKIKDVSKLKLKFNVK